MNKLKSKIFGVIFIILTLSILSFIVVFNYQAYSNEKKEIQKNIRDIADVPKIEFKGPSDGKSEEPPEKKEGEPPDDNRIFMDSKVYTIKLDENNEISAVITHSIRDENETSIREIATKILNGVANKSEDQSYMGNLYFTDYSYNFKSKTALTIIDNSEAKETLIKFLRNSIIIFVIAEIVIILVSKKIASMISKPVEEAFDKQKQFVADASHELKTPIAVITANAEALEKEPDETKWLENIKYESDRMNDLIHNLLELAKTENSNEKMNFERQNLSKIVEMEVLTFESLIFENNLTLEDNIDKEINFACNQGQMKQLVAILLDNSIKHSKEKGKVEVSLKKEKGNIILRVSNEGDPIKKGDEEKIFDRFYRADESRNRGENRYGLGLAIAKNIVENHNGKIEAYSRDGKTFFKIIFKI